MACLYSRFPYGDTLTIEKLSMVERAENIIREQGFRQVRVRMHGELARIEIEETEFPRFLQEGCMEKVRTALKELGFLYITLDLQGYRTGSMNQQIPLTE